MRERSLLLVVGLTLFPVAAAAQTGTVTGTVIRSDTAEPLAGVAVEITNASGGFAATTDASGVFTISSVTPGTYVAYTAFGAGFINEIHDNIPCIGSCTIEAALATGAAFPVTAGSVVTRDFSLAPGGVIRGRVTDEATSLPLVGVAVSIRNATGGLVTTRPTNATGDFATVIGLASGTYYASTFNGQGYFNEVYDNVTCGTSCPSTAIANAGTPIAVTAPATTSNIDFRLVKGARISGTITDVGTGSPLASVPVVVVTPAGALAGSSLSDSAGNFVTPALKAGTYFIYTVDQAGYVDEVYDNLSCGGVCSDVRSGTAIVVTAGATAPGRNFALTPGGRIAGTIRSGATSAPLANTAVNFFDPAGAFKGAALSDSSGAYISGGLATGTYYAYADNFDGYRAEIYDNIPCRGEQCFSDVSATGTPIAVTLGATTGGRDFLLDQAGRISGRVTNASTGAGVQGVTVFAAAPGGIVAQAATNASGDYSIVGLPAASYALLTGSAGAKGLRNEIYNNIPCPISCSTTIALFTGTKVAVATGGSVTGINLALTPGGSISGTVTNAATGVPLQNVSVFVLSSTVNTLSTAPSVVTNASGVYTVSGLPAGTYYAYTSNTQGFINETNGGARCVGTCAPAEATLSPGIVVAAGGVSGGVNFALEAGGRIAGRVTESATGQSISGGTVRVADANGRVSASATIDAAGNYLTGDGLPAGTYYAYTDSANGYILEIFDNAPCPGVCAPQDAVALGAPIVVAAGATAAGRDFALDAGGRVSGIISDAATGVVVPFSGVEFYDATGRFAASGPVLSLEYVTDRGLPTGTYYALTFGSTHVNEVYDNHPCPGLCEAVQTAAGTAITVTAGSLTRSKNFVLAPRTGVPGPPVDLQVNTGAFGTQVSWTPPVSGGLATSYQLEAGLAPGTTAISFPLIDPLFLATGVPPGQYYLRVRGINASGIGPASPDFVFVNGAGGAAPGTPVTVRLTTLGTRMVLTWADAVAGGAPTQYLVEAGTSSGLANIATLPASTRAFAYDPVPSGFYFLRVRASNATATSAPSREVMLVMGGGPAPPPAPRRVGATAVGSTVTINWAAPSGPVTGYIIEAGSANGQSNLAVLPVGGVTTMSFPGIPPGRYYVRVRAVNAFGMGIASDEMIVVVG